MSKQAWSAALDPAGMRARKESFARFARARAARVFKPDGTYQPETERDPRIPYWLYGMLVSSPDPAERAFANVIYGAAPAWDHWDVFTSSAIAANLCRHRREMTPELARRSERHLARFIVRREGRVPCSGSNDFVFHGYNDNMPALCVRALILAGDVLGRKDCTDQGLFNLEGLCAHFERRGLLSEYTSGTYTPITLVCLMDVVECSQHREARQMALACAGRILLDLFGHWHRGIGGLAGSQSRAYTADLQQWLSSANALMWYLTGDPLCVNPLEALRDVDSFPGYVHHGRNFAFNLAQFAEVMTPSFAQLPPPLRRFVRAPRAYPFEFYATSDSGQIGLLGGVREIQTRAWHRPLYALATSSHTGYDQAGQRVTLQALLSRCPAPTSWRDRISIWHRTLAGKVDHGELETVHGGARAEVGNVNDAGHYKVLQRRGSALVLGSLGPALLGKKVDRLRFSLFFNTVLHQPDEVVEDSAWHFLRFGEVYVGVRLSAMVLGRRIPSRRVSRHGYLRIEVPLLEGRPVRVDQEFREWCDFAYVFEIAARDECGSFARFRRQCLACTWELWHCFYRNSRYCGRHGELQIVDSVAAGTLRFMAVDGEVEPRVKLAVTGLDPKLARLFPDGRRIRQRRTTYRPHYVGSPYYPHREHILETDLPGPS